MNDLSPFSWDDTRIFLAVAESGSFGGAARALAITQPTVSRRIAELEHHTGQALFHRARSGATLTEEGARLLPAARQMARWATELQRAAQRTSKDPQGLVRIAAPPAIAFDFFAAFAANLRTTHPLLRLELLSSVDYLDLARGDADIALRMKPPTEPSLALMHTFKVHTAPCASPEYRDRLGPDPTPDQVDWIAWSSKYHYVSPNPELKALIPNFVPAFTSDSSLVQLRACREGIGAMFIANIDHPYLEDRGLVPLTIRDFPKVPPQSFYLVCPQSVEHIPRVQSVLRELLRELKRTIFRPL